VSGRERRKKVKEGQRYISVTVRIQREGDQFSAHCVELGTASCGGSLDEVFENIKEAIEVHLSALERLRERPRFFREHGIRLKTYHEPKRRIAVQRKVYTDTLTTTCNIPVPASA